MVKLLPQQRSRHAHFSIQARVASESIAGSNMSVRLANHLPMLLDLASKKVENSSKKTNLCLSSKAQSKSPFPSQNLNSKDIECLACSPIRLERLEAWLVGYPNKQDGQLLLNGFKFGFQIPYEGPREHRFSKNHGSAKCNSKLVEEIIMKEVAVGRVAGPFFSMPIRNLMISPVGLVPKSTPGEMRLIFDLSFPNGSSINEGIPREYASVSYTSFDAVVDMVLKEGQGCSLIKIDVKSAFRLLPIHPSDFSLLGMSVGEKIFVDKCLPFGLSASCALFEKFSTFLEWCIKQAVGSDLLIHYLDDFCGCAKMEADAQSMLGTALKVFEDMGVPVAEEKVEGPDTTIKFLGLEVDTIAFEIRIPKDKLIEVQRALRAALGRKKLSLREIQSLVGRLNFCCKAIRPGRAFCRRLIDATIGLKRPFHRTRVTEGMREDMLLWLEFLEQHNGVTIMSDMCWRDNHSLKLHVYTDAAGGLGFGAFFQNKWAVGEWPAQVQEAELYKDITFKELFPIVLALSLWGSELANQRVIFHCDNMSVVCIINKQSAKSKPVMWLVRKLVHSCLFYNIVLKAKHIEGSRNDIADAISRFQFNRFRLLAPEAEREPTPLPENIWTELIERFCR